ncbi:hypothetical protein B0H14DRAFT_3902765 [Mycena olivaceomarginata]|nr:hypothetical protein B0H14DRAFT_3902765 [Mycena olivaceomarginata]
MSRVHRECYAVLLDPCDAFALTIGDLRHRPRRVVPRAPCDYAALHPGTLRTHDVPPVDPTSSSTRGGKSDGRPLRLRSTDPACSLRLSPDSGLAPATPVPAPGLKLGCTTLPTHAMSVPAPVISFLPLPAEVLGLAAIPLWRPRVVVQRVQGRVVPMPLLPYSVPPPLPFAVSCVWRTRELVVRRVQGRVVLLLLALLALLPDRHGLASMPERRAHACFAVPHLFLFFLSSFPFPFPFQSPSWFTPSLLVRLLLARARAGQSNSRLALRAQRRTAHSIDSRRAPRL